MKKIIAILIIVIIVIGIIGVAFLGSTFIFEDSNEDRLIAVITSDKTVSRIGDGFNFSAVRSSGDIKEYSWNFDDGNTSFEPMAAHSYAEAGWYNVTLEIKSKSGNKANTTLAIGVQREDEYIERECGTERDLRLRSGSGRGI
ncbi:MAG: PKD domain-containing protein, partial [Thermoplasmata archaeon]|nr:PKD domain-containing protein [Thermoplasmata archaeon]